MIEVNKNELFPITVSLLDEELAALITDQTVYYDIRTLYDVSLSPPISGTLIESNVEDGIYKTEISVPDAGSYICYFSSSEFITGTEEIRISNENIYELAKSNRPYNVAVMDVVRSTVSGVGSQDARKVPIDKTDFIASAVKLDSDIDWSVPVGSGISYAHYKTISDDLPYLMGGAFDFGDVDIEDDEIDEFLELIDTPSTYGNAGGSLLMVDPTSSGVGFVDELDGGTFV